MSLIFIVRYVIYGFLWLCTMGKLNFWMLPNLTAECGFLESFVPLYEYEMKGEKSKKSKRRGSSSDEKSNDSKIIENKSNVKDETDANLKEPNEKKNKENIEKDEQENTLSVVKNNAESKRENNIMNDKNESGEESSSGGSKDDDWVKIKKDDTAEEIPNEVGC